MSKHDWSSLPALSVGLYYQAMEAMKELPLTKRAFQLVPGDIIVVGAKHVYVVEVTLSNTALPPSGSAVSEPHQTIQLAGAEARWIHHDWQWKSDKIMENGLLRFHPLQVLKVVRESTLPTLQEHIRGFEKELKAENEKAAEKRRKEFQEDADKRLKVEAELKAKWRAEWEAEQAATRDAGEVDTEEPAEA